MAGSATLRLDLKLFLVVTVVILLAFIPLAFSSWQAINAYGQRASTIHEYQVRDQVITLLRSVARERVESYQAFFDRIAVTAGMLGSQAETIYRDLDYYAARPLLNQRHHLLEHNGIWANSFEAPVISLYWGGPHLTPEVNAELRALTHLTPLFERAVRENPEIMASHLISMSGIGQYCTADLQSKRQVYQLPPPREFDLRDGEPLAVFSRDPDGWRGVRWTRVYKDDVIDGLILTASAPVYAGQEKLLAITGIDLPLGTIIDEVLNIRKSQADEVIQFSFLIDEAGRLIAFPQRFLKPFGLDFEPERFRNSADSLDLNLRDSALAEVADLAAAAISSQEYLGRLELESETYLVVTDRLEALGWVFGVVVRQGDVAAAFEEDRALLKTIVRDLGWKGGLVASLTLMAALLLMFFLVKFMVMPLRTLSRATRRVADGDLSVRCPATTRDEIGVLAASFNEMVEQLNLARDRQRQYADSLEVEVEQRNQELLDKKGELEITVDLLKKEIDRRQIISEALKTSQQQYYETMEATRVGIFIVTGGELSYVNTLLTEMLRLPAGGLISRRPTEFIVEEHRELVRRNFRKRLQGQEISPFRVKCIRGDRSVFFGEVWFKVTNWHGRTAVVGTVSDVSRVKLNEEKLRVQEIQLRQSLEEKDILLREIYHRTKNNMLVIISMLELQAADIDDERVRTIFAETESRIRAMALVHEKLYHSRNLSEIDLGSYLEEVSNALVANMVVDGRVRLEVRCDPVSLNIDYAIPLGLVINEIVTNSVQHAFPGGRSGLIYLRLVRSGEGMVELTVGDDGIGLSEDLSELGTIPSFGMQMIYNLIRSQLHGEVRLIPGAGTVFSISFEEPRRRGRV